MLRRNRAAWCETKNSRHAPASTLRKRRRDQSGRNLARSGRACPSAANSPTHFRKSTPGSDAPPDQDHQPSSIKGGPEESSGNTFSHEKKEDLFFGIHIMRCVSSRARKLLLGGATKTRFSRDLREWFDHHSKQSGLQSSSSWISARILRFLPHRRGRMRS